MSDQPSTAALRQFPVRELTQRIQHAPTIPGDYYLPLVEGERRDPPPPAVFINARSQIGWYEHVHQRSGVVPEQGLFFLRDVGVCGYSYVFRDDAFVTDQSEPNGVGLQFAQAEAAVQHPLRDKRQVKADRPLLIVAGPGSQIWGHWLLDFLPRLSLARHALGHDLGGYALPLPHDTPGWVYDMLGFFAGVRKEQVLTFRRGEEVVVAASACIPTFPHDQALHSLVAGLFRPFARTATSAESPERILVSRGGLGQTRSVLRSFRQQEYFEQRAQQAGFTVVHPQTLGFAAQIDLFARARVIVGEYGSGLHSAVFSAPGTVVGMYSMPNSYQQRIAALFGHRSVYLFADAERPDVNGGTQTEVGTDRIDEFFDVLSDG